MEMHGPAGILGEWHDVAHQGGEVAERLRRNLCVDFGPAVEKFVLALGQMIHRRPRLNVTVAFVVALPGGPGGSPGPWEKPEDKEPPAKSKAQPARRPAVKPGVEIYDAKASQGYTLLSPMLSTKTYLIDMQGRVVRTWESDSTPALSACLLENGHLLRPGNLRGGPKNLRGPGAGGRIQEFTWEGELVWDFKFASENQLPHHDITALPNGNILVIAWDTRPARRRSPPGAGRKRRAASSGPIA